jgi:hypothetical protein
MQMKAIQPRQPSPAQDNQDVKSLQKRIKELEAIMMALKRLEGKM